MTARQGFRRFAVIGALVGLSLVALGGPAAGGPGSDADSDGILDANDNCPIVANGDQLDTDGDDLGDACDSDKDNDAVSNASDNCELVPNGDQSDLDADLEGDACDADIDGDTHVNGQDNCPAVANGDQLDTDGDDIGDVCDPAPTDRPDARIRRANFALTPNDVYNTTAAGQARAANVGNRGTATFTVQTRNDGDTPDDVRVRAAGSSSRFTVVYRNGPTNVTAQVVAGTFQYTNLPANATRTLTVTIRAKAGTPVNAAITRKVTITSQTDTSIKDAVKATVTRR